jgi:hypothetical protein
MKKDNNSDDSLNLSVLLIKIKSKKDNLVKKSKKT